MLILVLLLADESDGACVVDALLAPRSEVGDVPFFGGGATAAGPC